MYSRPRRRIPFLLLLLTRHRCVAWSFMSSIAARILKYPPVITETPSVALGRLPQHRPARVMVKQSQPLLIDTAAAQSGSRHRCPLKLSRLLLQMTQQTQSSPEPTIVEESTRVSVVGSAVYPGRRRNYSFQQPGFVPILWKPFWMGQAGM